MRKEMISFKVETLQMNSTNIFFYHISVINQQQVSNCHYIYLS